MSVRRTTRAVIRRASASPTTRPASTAINTRTGCNTASRGPFSAIYFYSHVQVDAQGTIGLRRGLSLIASGLDLNNEVFGFYQGSPQYMIQREYYQPTFSAGLRWSPPRE
jgi:hypothetical protein